jgi:hypothetical protein
LFGSADADADATAIATATIATLLEIGEVR